MFVNNDVFDNCPSCQKRSSFWLRLFWRWTTVYKCPKCRRFFCDKCRSGSIWSGYRCPHCTFHVSDRDPKIVEGFC
jgi:DNA-directed RNA polymerase subunit RPC12/RpoP